MIVCMEVIFWVNNTTVTINYTFMTCLLFQTPTRPTKHNKFPIKTSHIAHKKYILNMNISEDKVTLAMDYMCQFTRS